MERTGTSSWAAAIRPISKPMRGRPAERYTTVREFGAVGNGLSYALGVAVAACCAPLEREKETTMAAAAQSITKPADTGVNPALPDYPGTRAIDSDRLNAFISRFVGDLGAAFHAGMVVIGERTGLYKALASG